MRCEHVKERWADYVTEAIGPAERSSIDRHLAECGSCRAEANELGRVWSLLGALPDETPSPGLRDRVEAVIDAFREGTRASRVDSRPGSAPQRSWWQAFALRPGWQLALAALLLVAGFAGGRTWSRPSGPDPELAALQGEVRAMKQMVALSLLQQRSAADRLRGVTWSYDIEQPGVEITGALLDTLRHDSNVNVRLSAVDALKSVAASKPGMSLREGLIESIQKQDSPLVQIAIVDALVELREPRSAGALRVLAADQRANEAVRKRAAWALAQLAQQS